MKNRLYRFSLIISLITLACLSNATVFAAVSQSTVSNATVNNHSNSKAQTINAHVNATIQLNHAKLNACHNRKTAINNIMARIDTRAKNQLALFSTIATRVENFYLSKGKIVSNYSQLVADINVADAKAQTDLSTLQTSSSFHCSVNNPKAVVTAFQGYLKITISDLQNYRTTVKNLIVAVASANGVKVSTSSQTNSSSGGSN